ncbi:hypothetical protein [Micromonospora sp. NPDC047740]|uniref:hypothetical protein n=1 Tax=Micromonospora sp. NPDC047740 TaxID=3364254 RepID=UPI00370FE7E7
MQAGPLPNCAAFTETGGVYDLDKATAEVLDELYHGTWFNESRRRESILVRAALGGRLVHACQGAPNMSGSCVVSFGTEVETMRRELAGMRTPWIERTLSPADLTEPVAARSLPRAARGHPGETSEEWRWR